MGLESVRVVGRGGVVQLKMMRLPAEFEEQLFAIAFLLDEGEFKIFTLDDLDGAIKFVLVLMG